MQRAAPHEILRNDGLARPLIVTTVDRLDLVLGLMGAQVGLSNRSSVSARGECSLWRSLAGGRRMRFFSVGRCRRRCMWHLSKAIWRGFAGARVRDWEQGLLERRTRHGSGTPNWREMFRRVPPPQLGWPLPTHTCSWRPCCFPLQQQTPPCHPL